MARTSGNLRKAAVLMRSVDADTAATLLAQLSPAEAAAVRQAIREMGLIDPDERADVLAEFRRAGPAATGLDDRGVELSLSSPIDDYTSLAGRTVRPNPSNANRFEFLENAPTSALAPYLAREHAQTIAVVLSHLAPARAAAVLAALPEKTQAEAIERLSVLGETDAESVTVVERELAAWLAKRTAGRSTGRRDAVASILAAADAKTRDGILTNLKTHKAALAEEIAPTARDRERRQANATTVVGTSQIRSVKPSTSDGNTRRRHAAQPPAPSPQPLPRIEFDQLIHLDARTLATVLGKMDANVLTLALAGSREELVDRICEQMPKRTARSFRRELRRLRPTRLSDVEAAQRAVAQVAAQQLAERRSLAGTSGSRNGG